MLRGTIAIPIRNVKGELVAYAGRRLKPADIDAHGKYVFPKGFKKELELFNFDRALSHAKRDGLILVEGFFATMRLEEAGFPSVAAVMGSSLSEAQAALAAIAEDVTILFDGDEAGRIGGAAAYERLAPLTTVRLVELPHDLAPDDLPVRTVRWLLNGLRLLDLARVRIELRPESH